MSLKKIIEKIIEKEDFNPQFWGLFCNPFYFARKGLYENINDFSKIMKGRLLDVGCGSKPYEKLFNVSEYIGLEYDTPQNRAWKKANFFYDGTNFPFDNDEFDCVVSFQVFEHVFNPENFLKEVNKVLKINGYFLMTVPFVWDEHEQPHDFARYSSFAIRYLLEKYGFEIIEQRKSINDLGVIFQLVNDYIYKLLMKNYTKQKEFLMRCATAPINIVGEILRKISPTNNDLYLDNVILVKKIKNA